VFFDCKLKPSKTSNDDTKGTNAMLTTYARKIALSLVALLVAGGTAYAAPIDNSFTFQGQLKADGIPLNDSADLRFTLWDAASAGNQVGAMITISNQAVIDGLFTVILNGGNEFGPNPFDGQMRYLEVQVRSPHDPGDTAPFTTLAPRQSLTASPYALQTRGLFVDENGKLGVGTSAPQQRLDVHGNMLLGANDVNSLVHAGGTLATSSDQHLLFVTDSNDLDGPAPNGRVIFGSGSSVDTDGNRAFTFNDAYPGGTPRNIHMVITGIGNVGVGTDNPASRLQVQGGSGEQAQGQIHIVGNGETGPGDAYISFDEGAESLSKWSVGVKDNDDAFSISLGLTMDEAPKLIIKEETGNVGIGTDNPASRLQVQGGSGEQAQGQIHIVGNGETGPGDAYISFDEGAESPSKWSVGVNDNDDAFSISLGLTMDQAPKLIIKEETGNVGIGTSNPTSPLGFPAANGRKVTYYEREDWGFGGVSYFNGFVRQWAGKFGAHSWGHADTEGEFLEYMRLNASGNLTVYGATSTEVLTITGGSDLSESFNVKADAEATVEPGMVVAIDPANPGGLTVATQAYDKKVAGVISGAGGVNTGMLMGHKGTIADGRHPVALTGRVYVWCDAASGAIEPGDLLTTSTTPGHAMKASNTSEAPGATIGKAMTSLQSGKGLVLVLVSLQ
jgi:hypothetical protein